MSNAPRRFAGHQSAVRFGAARVGILKAARQVVLFCRAIHHSHCEQCRWQCGSRIAQKIIRLTIQTDAKFDSRSKSGALTKMLFSLDIAQGNTGGLRFGVSANSSAEFFSPGSRLGLTPRRKRRLLHETASGDASPSPDA